MSALASSRAAAQPRKPKLLLAELWGLGDLTMATTLIGAASEEYDVVVLGKPHAATLLRPSYPAVRFISWDAPWTAFRRKYDLWRWNWRELFGVLRALRRERFDVGLSVRCDPRDHLLLWLAGARRRIGFPVKWSALLLTHRLQRRADEHRVEDWRTVGRALRLPRIETAQPFLDARAYDYPRERPAGRLAACVHTGSRIAVRRWPEASFRQVIMRLRELFDLHLTVIPDPDGYGSGLADLADEFKPQISVEQLVAILGSMEVVLCNDSAPAHIASACGVSTIALFGPTNPNWYRPWGDDHQVVIRDICPYRPCFDYCRFPEPYCLTKISPDDAWPEIEAFFRAVYAKNQPSYPAPGRA